MLTDTHAHLDFPQLAADTAGVLARAEKAGVTRIVTIGTGIESSRRAVALAEKFPAVWAAAGVHPNHVADEDPNFLPALRDIAAHPRIVAIGETGLDYFRLPKTGAEPAKIAQAAAFRAQLALAADLALPVIVHERAAWDDTLAILREFTGRVRAVLHCFGRGPEHAREVIALGHLVSFTGIVTFPNAPDAQASAATLPAGTFMVETDSPFLAPVPHRGKPCEPAFTADTARHISALRGIPLAEFAAQTERAAEDFFRFGRRR